MYHVLCMMYIALGTMHYVFHIYIIYIYIYISPCPFLKKVEVASDGGGTTIPVKVMKVASSPHSLKKMEVASPPHPLKKMEVAFPFHLLEKVEVAPPLPSVKNVAIHIYIIIRSAKRVLSRKSLIWSRPSPSPSPPSPPYLCEALEKVGF